MNYPSEDNYFLREHVAIMNNSFRKLLGEDLVMASDSQESLAKAVFYAPCAVVSHSTAAIPVFNYANLKAIELFGFGWDEFTQLPSRLSAEPQHQLERNRLLEEVSQKGYSNGYKGIRISKNGRRFLIKNAVVWNLIDSDGCYAGQAARFGEWEFL